MNVHEREQVISKIEIAFEQTPYPGDTDIGIGIPDGDEVEQAFRGKHWKALTLDMVFNHRDKLPFLKPNAFRFFLPAYLLATLRYFDKVDTLFENLLFNLVPLPENQVPSRLMENAKAMSRNEKLAIFEFFKNYQDLFPDGYFSEETLRDAISGKEFWAKQLDT